jgi:hypothetical protein
MGGLKLKLFLVIAFLVVLLVATLSLAEKQVPLSLLGGKELFSPSDWIKEEQIKVYQDKVVLEIDNPLWATFTNTNSMDPFIDESSHAIEISPESADSINVGDVISYNSKIGVVIHRVIDKGKDEQGIYYIVKGDNNNFKDPFKVRFSDVVGVVVAVIY